MHWRKRLTCESLVMNPFKKPRVEQHTYRLLQDPQERDDMVPEQEARQTAEGTHGCGFGERFDSQ